MSWNELARRSHVSATYLKDMAAGRRGHGWPSPPLVEAVAAALEIEPESFLLVRARAVLERPELIDYAWRALVEGRIPA